MVFFRKYLGDLVRERQDAPLLCPSLLTISDFFCRVYRSEATDRLKLLLELYDCYRELNPQAEPLDDFLYWGEVMLSDFDDIDKYLADARSLLQNVSDFKSLQDGFEYLNDNQRQAVEHFLSHFRDGKGMLKLSPEGSDVKARFLKLWNLLLPLYELFRKRLQQKGMAYEGMVYRDLAQKLLEDVPVKDILEPVFSDTEQYVFVGMNALTACEHLLLARMRDARLARFVWDFVSEEIRDPENKASFFMRENVRDYPQDFAIDPTGLGKPEISVVSVPSSVGQAKLVPYILRQTGSGQDDMETAFVLPDESLLLPLLNSIPPEHSSVNVTMGYPMAASAVYALLDALGQLQLRMRHRPDGWYFYHRQVREVFSSGLFRSLLSPEEGEKVNQVKKAAKYYIPLQDLQGGPVLDLLFRPVVEDVSLASARQNHRMERYFSGTVALVGRMLPDRSGMLLELDFAKRCHTQLNILQETDLELLPATHLRLLKRILEGISVPFRGEPLQGLQVMGPLETRALDFRNLVVFSANEGMFPRRSYNPSFIPPELRKGFGLPTYEYQDAVWAYYFYRMIQRPERVWLLYDSRTEGLKTGEESRFVKQLEYHFHLKVEKMVVTEKMFSVKGEDPILKTAEDVRKIREGTLSASVIQNYLKCPAKFYYQFVKGLKTDDEVAESLDAGMLGNVFHQVMRELYDRTVVSPSYLQELLRDSAGIRKRIRSSVLEQMRSIEVGGRNLVLEEVILDYVLSTLRYDRQLLLTSGSEGFRILGLEKVFQMDFEGFHLKGFVDRIDSYRPGEVRIVDYKTGKVEDEDLLITDENAAKVVEKLFSPESKKRPKIALQLFIYGLFAHGDPDLGSRKLLNAIYSTAWLYTRDLPEVSESPEFLRLMRERLRDLLEEMVTPEIPFRRTQDANTCQWCDFKNICGR